MHVLRLVLLTWTPGALLWLAGWSMFWARPRRGSPLFFRATSSGEENYAVLTVFSTAFWPISVVAVTAIVLWQGLLRHLFWTWPRSLYWHYLDRRDENLLKRLRKNPSLLEKIGTRVATHQAVRDDQLWRIEFRGPGEDMVVLRVKDRTSDETYIIRVPPRESSTVEGAVAWTFSRNFQQYQPVKVT